MRLIDADKLFENVGKIKPRNKEHYKSIGEFMNMITNTPTTEKKYEYEDYVTLEDNMTTEEIIRILKYIKRGYIPDYNFTGDEDDIERFEMHTAMDKAINIIQNLHVKEQREER